MLHDNDKVQYPILPYRSQQKKKIFVFLHKQNVEGIMQAEICVTSLNEMYNTKI